MHVFDIIGPIMIGPSSSHTAGAARIGRIRRARYIAQAKGTRRELGEACKSAALKWVRKQPRMKTCRLDDIENVERVTHADGTRRFEIRATGQRFTLK